MLYCLQVFVKLSLQGFFGPYVFYKTGKDQLHISVIQCEYPKSSYFFVTFIPVKVLSKENKANSTHHASLLDV
uniref:Uncharacterized protein n=1 Tax=Anguilla anguilla TaxID=7936 RepID=A0A0E9XY87_ANGAN